MSFQTLQRLPGLSAIVLILVGFNHSLSAQQYDPPDTDAEFERQYQERIKKDRLHGIYIPKNLDDALDQLDKLSSDESKQVFMAIPEDSVCLIMHNRLGQWMIVNWSFYQGSRLSHYLRSAGVTYPDDMADFMILAFHKHLNKKPISIRDLAVHFREKRQEAWNEEKKEGEVLEETIRKRPKTDEKDLQQKGGDEGKKESNDREKSASPHSGKQE